MLPSLLVAAAITAPAAPMPKDTLPNPTGPAPRVVAVKADASGSVWITANVYEKRKFPQQYVAVENGKQVVKTQEIEQTVSNYVRKQLGDFGGKFVTAGGVTLTTEEATRRVKEGATLLITSDGKPIDKSWLKAVADDTVVMTAEGLGTAHFVHGNAPFPTSAAPRLAMLSTDDKGAVRLPVNPNGNQNGQIYYDDFGGRGGGRMIRGKVMIQNNIDFIDEGYGSTPATTPAGSDGKKALPDVKFDAYDATGKLVTRGEALERLKAGGLVVIAGDNRFPDADYLKAFRGDILVLVSGELTFPAGVPNPYDLATKPAAPAKPNATQPQPAPPVQLQLAPAVGRAAPAVIKQVQIQIDK
jgi:hypothetical protein